MHWLHGCMLRRLDATHLAVNGRDDRAVHVKELVVAVVAGVHLRVLAGETARSVMPGRRE